MNHKRIREKDGTITISGKIRRYFSKGRESMKQIMSELDLDEVITPYPTYKSRKSLEKAKENKKGMV